MSDELRALYGTDEALPEETLLEAGPLSAIFTGGALRKVSLAGTEIIRGIDFLVRDRNWATMVPDLRDLAIERAAGGFTVTFACHGKTPADGQDFAWRGRIEGSAKAGLNFTAEATPDTDVTTCRTGFVVLHPLSGVVGSSVTIEHTDGSVEETAFPDLIDPLQVFFDIRAMTHEPMPGVKATCRMAGGAWETEDHRNWLDASFKTYFRPLALPWPYTLPAGEPVAQSVSLSFEPAIGATAGAGVDRRVTVAIGDRTGTAMPRIGLAVGPEELEASLAVASRARPLSVQRLAIRVSAATPDLPGVLRKAARLAVALAAEPVLEIVLPLDWPYKMELDLVAAAAASAGLAPAAVVVSPAVDLKSYPPSVDRPASPPLALIYAAARNTFPGMPLGGGMFSYFTELNRRRVPTQLLDFVQHATASIVHAADDRSVMETLESLPYVFRSVRAMAGATPYRIGPANIAMGFNPYGASTSPNPHNLKRSMVTDDPRQTAQFAAAWAAGYLARAAAGGLEGVTLMAPAGPFGLVAPDGTPRAAFHVVQSFAAAAGAAFRSATSSDPQRLLACACDKDGKTFVWLANLTPATVPVTLAGVTPSRAKVLAGGPLAEGTVGELAPYGVAFVEG